MQDSTVIAELLADLGVDVAALTGGDQLPANARVVVVQASMDAARKSLSDMARDQVIMARVDLETAQALDRWVEVGLAKSRSEAAALFMREGLKIREADLTRLADAFENFDSARDRLKREAANILGEPPAE